MHEKKVDLPANPSSKCQRLLAVSGSLLVLLGLCHLIVYLVLGGLWEGAVSWRKPILFGLSTGATVLSIAWLYPKLKPWKWDTLLCGLFGAAMVGEVSLISIQQWRGVASHFNRTTEMDSLIESWMTYLIIFATLVLVEFTRRCFGKMDAQDDLKLAIRGGMTLLIISCLIGFAILFYGHSQVANNADPSTFGKAGVTKFPHGVAIHAIQFFPIACWLMCKLGLGIERRFQLTACLVASTSVFLLYSLVQTLSGRGRFDFTYSGAALLALSVVLLLPFARALFEIKPMYKTTE